MVEKRVKIYCITDEICCLIKKVLNKHNIISKCENYKELSVTKSIDEIVFECRNSADVVVLDQELDREFKQRMVTALNHLTFICLPSLKDNDLPDVPENVYQISEPFKLSEFEEVLLRILNEKTI
ncbi:MAG: hypothetical protein WC644_06945 [Ignavibacteria bacterium]